MPSSSLPADDLRIGTWVAIRDVVDDDRPSFLDEGEPPIMRRLRRESPAPQPGIPLRIIAVELPWAYVAVLDDDGDEVGPAIVDVRRHDLVRISPAIPEAIIAFGRKKREDEAQREVEAGRRKAVARARAEFDRRATAETGDAVDATQGSRERPEAEGRAEGRAEKGRSSRRSVDRPASDPGTPEDGLDRPSDRPSDRPGSD